MKITVQQTFVMTEELTTGLLSSECFPLSL